MEGDGSIVIKLYVKTNLLDDRGAFITKFVTANPPIYSTEPVKGGVGLSARIAIEDFSARCMFDIFLVVFCLDYVSTYNNVDLALFFTDFCKQIQHLRQSFKDKHGQCVHNSPD